MKKVVLDVPGDITPVSNVSNKKYYAFKIANFVGTITLKSGMYYCLCADQLTSGNDISGFKNICLDAMIKDIVQEGFHVFEFETPKELFAWLAENA